MSTARPEPPDPWWRAPAIIAAVLGAIGAIIAALISAGVFSSHGNAAAPAPTTAVLATSPPVTTTSEPTTTEPATTTSSGPPIRRRGRLVAVAANISPNLDLDSRQQDWMGSSRFELSLNFHDLILRPTAWISSRKQADYRACSDKSLIVRSVDNVPPNDVQPKMNLCIETDEGRLALLHIDRIVLEDSDTYNLMAFTVTIWDKENP